MYFPSTVPEAQNKKKEKKENPVKSQSLGGEMESLWKGAGSITRAVGVVPWAELKVMAVRVILSGTSGLRRAMEAVARKWASQTAGGKGTYDAGSLVAQEKSDLRRG